MLSTQIRTLLLEIQHGRHFKFKKTVSIYTSIHLYIYTSINLYICDLRIYTYVFTVSHSASRNTKHGRHFKKLLKKRFLQYIYTSADLHICLIHRFAHSKPSVSLFGVALQSAVSSCFICFRETVSF